MKKGLTVLMSISALGLILTGCGAGGSGNATTKAPATGTNTSKPVEGGSIVLDETQALKDLDPALAYDQQSYEVVDQLYNQLVTYKPGTSNTVLTGMDAKALPDISSDKKTYTLHLRDGLKFSDNTPVTAQSFIDEFQRVATKSIGSGGEYFIENIVGEQAFYNGTAPAISGLSAPNSNTLVIHLTSPNAAELNVLALPFFSPVELSFINQVGVKTFDSTRAMGDGPFTLQSINSEGAVLVKNPDYWMKDSSGNKLPYLDKVTIRVNTNAQIDALNFEQGTTAWLGTQQAIPSASFPHFESTPSLSKLLTKVPENWTYYLGLNFNIAPFNNKLVRQAVEYAVDKKKLVKLVNGRGVVANQPLPPNMPGYVKNLPANATYNFNQNKAKALLKQANVDPTKTTLTLYSYNGPDQLKEDESIQQDLENIGFKVNIKSSSLGAYLDKVQTGKAQMFTGDWEQDYPDPADFLFLFLSNQAPTENRAMYSNKQVDQWMATANTSTNQQERVNLYGKVSIQVMQDAVWVPLFYPEVYYAVQPWVHGWYAPATLMDPMKYVWIDKGHTSN